MQTLHRVRGSDARNGKGVLSFAFCFMVVGANFLCYLFFPSQLQHDGELHCSCLSKVMAVICSLEPCISCTDALCTEEAVYNTAGELEAKGWGSALLS